MTIANTPEAWSERAATAETSHEAALWSANGQHARFSAVLGALDPQPEESLLDFGCGTGGFCEWLRGGIDYVGYDWSFGMIARAIGSHPGSRFVVTEPQGPFDLVACIGPFNLPDNWSKQQTWDTLTRLWARAGRALAVNLYCGDDVRCLRYDSTEIPTFAGARHRIHRPLPNDLLVVYER